MQPETVLHIPHSSNVIPPELRESFSLSDAALAHELHLLTDWNTDELFCLPPTDGIPIIFPVSRLVVDPERFLDDHQEPMAMRGMGVLYTRTSDGAILRQEPAEGERAALLDRYYAPHHRRLLDATDAAVGAHGYALIIDCHSFPSQSLPCHSYHDRATADICLGTDDFHTPSWLRELACQRFEAAGFSVTIDDPFSGALVPLAHYRRTAAVHAIMVEINRRCYMDETEGGKLPQFDGVAGRLQACLTSLIRATRSTR